MMSSSSSSSSSSVFCFLLFLLSLHLYSAAASDCIALRQFVDSFTITEDASRYFCYDYQPSQPKTSFWDNGTSDCCSWDGVTCDNDKAAVIGIDLSCSWLQGGFDSNSSLFSLRSLRRLNLAGNYFEASEIPSTFRVFLDMTHLNLSGSYFKGLIPREVAYLSKLESLDLSIGYGSNLMIEDNVLKSIMQNLTRLRRLSLDKLNLSQASSPFANLSSSSLNYLSLSGCGLKGFMVSELFRLPKLEYLYLFYNVFHEILSSSDNWTSPLLALDLSWTNSEGRLLKKIVTLKTFRYLNLQGNPNIVGEIPASIGNLTALEYLDLLETGIGGSLPSTFANLEQLSYLYLGDSSNMTGVVDFEIFANMRKMRTLIFPANSKLDVLVQDGGNLSFPELTQLLLRGCNLTKFPYFLTSSKGLQDLDLSENMITGPIPRWLWSLGNDTLEVLYLSDNLITGVLSPFPWKKLSYVKIQNNLFTGIIPSSICQLSQLSSLSLSDNQLSGTIPGCISNLTELKWLDVGSNHLDGPFPWTLSNLTNLVLLDLSKNNFIGPIPVPPPKVQSYDVSDNNFTGEIPAAICDATGLTIINLSNNSLVGSIPRCLAKNDATLSVLNLRNNKLIGKIPRIFGLDNRLQTLDLSQNNLSGSLTRSLKNCKDLEVFDISNNAIEDVFPSWLAVLPELKVLVLRSNRFYGPIHYHSGEIGIHPFRQLRIFDISVNRFSGPLPTKYMAKFKAMIDYSEQGNLQFVSKSEYNYKYDDSVRVVMKGLEFKLVKILKVFTTIDLSANFFEGEFPGLVGNLKALKGLNFSHNHITGNISPSVRNLSELEWLDLSSNNLSGEIPPGMADLTFLTYLNLSMNRLTGPIPTGKQFNTFGSNAFEGNPGLCGLPLLKTCGSNSKDDQDQPPNNGDEEDEGEDEWIEWKAVPVGYIFGIVFGFTLGYYYLSANS